MGSSWEKRDNVGAENRGETAAAEVYLRRRLRKQGESQSGRAMGRGTA